MKFLKEIKFPWQAARKKDNKILPFEKDSIVAVEDRFSTFRFARSQGCFKIHSNFEIFLDGNQLEYNRLTPDLLRFFIGFVNGKQVEKARINEWGTLEITIEGGLKLWVEDGPFDGWEYTSGGAPAEATE